MRCRKDGCKASENFENYLNKYPEGRNKISAHNYLASCYYENKDYEEAAMWYYNAINETQPLLSIAYREEYPKQRLEEIRAI